MRTKRDDDDVNDDDFNGDDEGDHEYDGCDEAMVIWMMCYCDDGDGNGNDNDDDDDDMLKRMIISGWVQGR